MDGKKENSIDCFIGDVESFENEIKKGKEEDFLTNYKGKSNEKKHVSISKMLDEIRGENNA